MRLTRSGWMVPSTFKLAPGVVLREEHLRVIGLLTGIPSQHRNRVLDAFADPTVTIGHQWLDCLVGRAVEVIDGFADENTVCKRAQILFGWSERQVNDVAHCWDFETKGPERTLIRETIRRIRAEEITASQPVQQIITDAVATAEAAEPERELALV